MIAAMSIADCVGEMLLRAEDFVLVIFAPASLAGPSAIAPGIEQ
eukprot:CAMPEP_0114511878 /NCGR_PEP_ID=MMETSP0109-20121206/14651_1 /TAXON_ID=29199 /ORGANISM="Chlorarachnion reptans, Strain CCCM449" /LENGTH=43 /DNA_ID= /DNA_START= /DNA_END= /DNA_ORIENTATION=